MFRAYILVRSRCTYAEFAFVSLAVVVLNIVSGPADNDDFSPCFETDFAAFCRVKRAGGKP